MKYLLISFFCLFISLSFGQTRQAYDQYMLNPGLLNPANMDIFTKYGTTLVYHNDFMGQTGSPLNFGLTSYYNRRPHQGLGGTIINDNYGNYNQLEVAGNYSYKIFSRAGGGVSSAFGLRIGLLQHSINSSKLYYKDNASVDPTLTEPRLSSLGLNVGFGYAFVTNKFDLNVSLPQILGNRMPFSGVDTLPKRKFFDVSSGNYFLSMGYKYRWDNDFYVFYPTLMVKGVGGAPLQAQVDFNFLLNQLIWCGVGFKSDITIASSVGVFLDQGLRIVYSYHNQLATKHPETSFSHELSVGYAKTIPDDPFKYRKYTSPTGEVKKPKFYKIKLPKLKFLKKLKAGRRKFD